MGELNLLAKSDYPAKQKVMKISTDKTVQDLKDLAAQSTDLVADKNEYSYFAVAYGHDVIELSKKDDSEILNTLDLKDKSTIFMYASSNIRPEIERKKEGKKKKEEK